MTDISMTIERLKKDGIESFEHGRMVVVPCSTPDEIYDTANAVRRIFKEIGYEKSWRIDPYFTNSTDNSRNNLPL